MSGYSVDYYVKKEALVITVVTTKKDEIVYSSDVLSRLFKDI